ncbi:MAG: hypothetical protein AB8B80_08370 [Marinicellaceae bacterium]
MKKVILLSIFGALAYLVYLQLSPHHETWLHGKWEYQGSEPDYMTFYKDGTLEMSDSKRIYARCIYASVVGNEVSVKCKAKNKTHELEFIGSNEARTLTNKKHNDSIYNKKEA